MEEFKKERSSNFTAREISVLLQIVKEYSAILECKKTDGTTWKQKDECWEKVAAELNSHCGENIRSKKSIKSKYDDLKKNVKKKLAKNKVETFKTGGGVPKIIPLTSTEEMLLTILDPAQTYGLPTLFDSDAIEGAAINLDDLGDNVLDSSAMNTDEPADWLIETLDDIDNDGSVCPRFPCGESDFTINADKVTTLTANLLNKTPISDILQSRKTRPRAAKGVDLLRTNVSRELRKCSKSSQRIETIAQLAISTEQLVRMQIEVLKQDMEMRKKTDALQLKILDVELETKRNRMFSELEINQAKLESIKLEMEMKRIDLAMKKQLVNRD